MSQDHQKMGAGIDRRRFLTGVAATGFATGGAGVAGGTRRDAADRSDDDTPASVSQTDAEFVFASERPDIGSYDLAESTLADDNMALNPVYDGLRRRGRNGEWHNWMAESYEAVDAQDVSMPDDYVPYMQPYEIQDIDDFDDPVFDLAEDNLVLPTSETLIGIAAHPDDIDAFQNGDIGVGDDMRILTRTEAADAVADGTYGIKVEGKLRESIQFHNDTECTAADLVGSYDRYVGSTNQGQVFNSFLHAQAPDGDDSYTFELYAQEADAVAATELPPNEIYPEEHHDVPPGGLDPRTEGGQTPIGTGPYEIAGFEEGNFLLLERTDSYWVEEVGVETLFDVPDGFPDGPVIDSVQLVFQPEDGQRVAALQNVDIDATYELQAGAQTYFFEDEDFTAAWTPSTLFEFMQFPLEDTAEDGAFAEQSVRQAASVLAPRWAMVNIVDDGWGVPARVPFPKPAAGLGTGGSYEDLEDSEWAYPVEPAVAEAESLLEEVDAEPPVEMIIETNADGQERQARVQLYVAALNDSGLFDAVMETPADFNTWFVEYLTAPDSNVDYAERNATAFLGLGAGSDPHGYAQTLHHPNNYNGCCNFFNPAGTFGFIDLLESCRYGTDVATDPDLRRQRYDQLWPQIAETSGNTFLNYDLEVVVSGPNVSGLAAHPDRQGFLRDGLYAPYDNRVAWTGEQPPGAEPVAEEAPPGFNPPGLDPLPGFENPPQDLDDDGLHRDVDGDGEFTIFDVQAFFNHFDSDVVQNNPDAFNFDGNGEIDIFDVQALFNQLIESE